MNKPFILLVDEEPDILSTTAMFLKKNFNVYAVKSGKDALEVIGIIKVDCLVTHINMPLTDGLELLGKIKDEGYSMRTVVVSGEQDDQFYHRLKELGMDRYLKKPFGIDELVLMIYGLLSDSVKKETPLTTTFCMARYSKLKVFLRKL